MSKMTQEINMLNVYPTNSLQIADLIRQSFDELTILHEKLTPFDKCFDEDLLECKHQQKDMILNELTYLKDNNADVKKIKSLEEFLDSVDNDIEIMTITRMVEYSKWKLHYMSICNKINEMQNKIRSLMQLERNMNSNG